MRLSARVDYALRAVVELAAAPAGPVTAERIARAQEIPPKFLESILLQLRRGGIVNAQRGPDGGYWLARPAGDIPLADIIRVIDGLPSYAPGDDGPGYHGAARALREVWIVLQAREREVLELVTVEHLRTGELPPSLHDRTGTGSPA